MYRRNALVSVLVAVVCWAGYVIAFQTPAPVSGPSAYNSPAKPASPEAGPIRSRPVPTREYAPYPPAPPAEDAPRFGNRFATTSVNPLSPQPVLEIAEPLQQQLSVLISNSGLRFLSPKSGLDAGDEISLEAGGIFVICDRADVTTDAQGQTEVVCHAAAVIKASGMAGKANRLRYKSGLLVLEGDDADSLIARNKGDKTVFLLRAKTINVNLNTQQIEASDGSVVQLKTEAKPVEKEQPTQRQRIEEDSETR